MSLEDLGNIGEFVAAVAVTSVTLDLPGGADSTEHSMVAGLHTSFGFTSLTAEMNRVLFRRIPTWLG